jgi:hypothetical protein
MTVADLRELISNYDESELRDEYECYNTMQARGVKDEIRLTLLEEELCNRSMSELY